MTAAGTSAIQAVQATIGAVIAIYTFFDALLIGLPILLLTAWLNPLAVFVGTLVVVTLLDLATCRWVDRQWDAWVAGTRFEARMQKVRTGSGPSPGRVDQGWK